MNTRDEKNIRKALSEVDAAWQAAATGNGSLAIATQEFIKAVREARSELAKANNPAVARLFGEFYADHVSYLLMDDELT